MYKPAKIDLSLLSLTDIFPYQGRLFRTLLDVSPFVYVQQYLQWIPRHRNAKSWLTHSFNFSGLHQIVDAWYWYSSDSYLCHSSNTSVSAFQTFLPHSGFIGIMSSSGQWVVNRNDTAFSIYMGMKLLRIALVLFALIANKKVVHFSPYWSLGFIGHEDFSFKDFTSLIIFLSCNLHFPNYMSFILNSRNISINMA